MSRTLILLLFLALLGGCRQALRTHHAAADLKKSGPAASYGLPRVSPAYVQWLSLQSMLGQGAQYIDEVSGTSRMWQHSATEGRYQLLLRAAPNWLDLNPHLERELQPVFKTLARSKLLNDLKQLGLQGLYLSPTGETAEVWQKISTKPSNGEDIVSFNFARACGSDQDFTKLREQAELAGLQLGGSLPPAATGLGADFMLQARAVVGYEGLYAALALPKEAWDLLGKVTEPWDITPLKESSRQALVDKGLLPWELKKSRANWANQHGWAATGPVPGLDGQVRRWIFCYDQSPTRPVLFWQDPSGQAKRLFAAATIRHVGLQQQVLASLSVKALMGLDALREGEDTQNLELLEPGLGALGEITQAVHRYGGLTLVADEFPSFAIKYLLEKADFVYDSQLAQALKQALASGECSALYKHLQKTHQEQSRLVSRFKLWPKQASLDADFSQEAWLELAVPLGLPGLLFISTKEIKALSESKLRNLLVARTQLGLAEGKLLPPLPAPTGCLITATLLPKGGYWISAANFSKRQVKLRVSLPKLDPRADLLDLSPLPLPEKMTKDGPTVILTLAPRQSCSAYLGPRPGELGN